MIADNILKGMQAADLKVQEEDPFTEKVQVSFGRRDVSPYVNRMRLMWAQMREGVIAHFPAQPRHTIDIETYMAKVEDKYVTDAYHSLSIEGYRVTRELIQLVRFGNWHAEGSDESKKHVDAMAAKGYWDAFQEVKKAVLAVLEGKNPGDVLEQAHSDWYLALFSPTATTFHIAISPPK